MFWKLTKFGQVSGFDMAENWSKHWTSLIAQVWVYSSQALMKLSGLPDLLFGHVGGQMNSFKLGILRKYQKHLVISKKWQFFSYLYYLISCLKLVYFSVATSIMNEILKTYPSIGNFSRKLRSFSTCPSICEIKGHR